jgi:NAD(P)-dependent dehydrogenase (short-subunit alcohol dehydrogenase family)
MQQLQGKVAFITGAGRGVGKGLARAFAAEGATVIIASRNVEVGTAAAQEINRDYPQGRAVFLQTDVADLEQFGQNLEHAAAQYGDIDILVNNATPSDGQPARLEDTDFMRIEQQTRVNYYAALRGMQTVFPAMKAKGSGRIINLCSLNGVNAHRFSVGYNSSKEALRALTRTAAAEWGRYGVTCNVICPAAVTEHWENYVEMAPEFAQSILDMNPMGRLGDSELDIGPLAVFLASDAARYITGNTIHADGGAHINGVPWFYEPPA